MLAWPILFLVLAAHIVHAVAPAVNLDYRTFVGEALPNGVTRWLGVRYASAPIAHLRFAAPRDPALKPDQVAKAHKPRKGCYTTYNGNSHSSEDCLFLSLWAPSNATTDSRLPVYFYIHGGGYVGGNVRDLNPMRILVESGYNMIVVAPNYRLGMFGFMGGKEMEAHGSLNNGLKDQVKALEWVQKHIERFGGDPGHVVIGGASAGGGSVAALLAMYGGNNRGLFHGAIGSSPWTPSMRSADELENQFIYNTMVFRTGCAKATNTLQCLRGLRIEKLQAAHRKVLVLKTRLKPKFTFGPVIDGGIVPDYTPRAFHKGNVAQVPTLFGGVASDGISLVERALANIFQVKMFLRTNLPYLTEPQLDAIVANYSIHDPPTKPPSMLDRLELLNGIGAAFDDFMMRCPALLASDAMHSQARQSRTYNYLWAPADPKLFKGHIPTPHMSDKSAFFGKDDMPQSYQEGGLNERTANALRAYFISFIRTLDPNTHRLEGSPEWIPWSQGPHDALRWNRMIFKTNETGRMEKESVEQWERCNYFKEVRLNDEKASR